MSSSCSAVLEKDNVNEMEGARTTKSLLGQHRVRDVQRYITEDFPELQKYQREFNINHRRIRLEGMPGGPQPSPGAREHSKAGSGCSGPCPGTF